MKAIILAAGRGIRLGSLTERIPKCLIKINNMCLLDYQIRVLKKNNINEIFVVVGYKKELIFEKINAQVTYIVNSSYSSTNSSYSLWLAKKHLYNDSFVYLNGDLFFHGEIISQLLKDNNEFAGIVDKSRQIKNSDSFKAKLNDHEIVEMRKNLQSEVEVPGPFYLSARISKILFDEINKEINNDRGKWVYTYFNQIAQYNSLKAVFTTLPWVEIDTIEDYHHGKELNDRIFNKGLL